MCFPATTNESMTSESARNRPCLMRMYIIVLLIASLYSFVFITSHKNFTIYYLSHYLHFPIFYLPIFILTCLFFPSLFVSSAFMSAFNLITYSFFVFHFHPHFSHFGIICFLLSSFWIVLKVSKYLLIMMLLCFDVLL